MPKRYQRFAARLALLTASLAIGLCIGEGLLRLFCAPSTGAHELFCQFDPVLGWRKIPNFSGRHVTAEYDVLETFNSRGLRGPEYHLEKPSDIRRVLVLGDSFVEGYCVSLDETMTQVMQRTLNEQGEASYEVLNGGTGGYSTDQELLFYQREGRQYRPDITVLAVYDNDLESNVRSKYWRGDKPLYRLDSEGQLLLTNTPLAHPPSPRRRSRFARGRAWLDSHSRLYGLARAASKRSSRLRDLFIAAGLASAAKENRYGGLLEVYRRRPSSTVEQAWRITDALIAELNRDVAADGGRLIVCYIPPRFQVDPSLREDIVRDGGFSDDQFDWNNLTGGLSAICSRHEIPWIDPTEEFRRGERELAEQAKSNYFPIDGHWTADGHRLVGELLARWISDQGSP